MRVFIGCFILNFQLPDNREIIYEVPVMKYWLGDDIMLINKKLYSLLPLQLIMIRKKLKRNKSKEQLRRVVDEVKELSKRITVEKRGLSKLILLKLNKKMVTYQISIKN